MSSSNKSIADVLTEAAEIVAKGWSQGEYFCMNGTCCLIGALTKARTGVSSYQGDNGEIWRTENSPEARYVARAINSDELVYWNDEPGRTQAEVVAALRKAAQLAEANHD